MKQTFKLLAILIAVSFAVTSRGGDKKKELVGKWEYSKVVFDVETSDTVATNKIKSMLNVPVGESASLEFTKDGIVIMSDSIKGTYTVSGDRLTTLYEKLNDTGKYSINGDTLVIQALDSSLSKFAKLILETGHDYKNVKLLKADVYAYFVRKK